MFIHGVSFSNISSLYMKDVQVTRPRSITKVTELTIGHYNILSENNN